MGKAPAFQFYANDFMDATSTWPAIACGLYVRCLCKQWTHGSIPADLKTLARATHCDLAEVQEAWPLVGPKFLDQGDGTLKNSRLEEVRARQNEVSEERSKAGKAGAIAKANARANESTNVKQRKVKEKEKVEREDEGESEAMKSTREPEIAEAVLWPTFLDWWDLYDRKADRKKCEGKWNRLDHPTKTAIMEHTRLYITQGRGSDPKYRRDPATYLNNENWNDDELTQRRISQGDNASLDIATKARMAMEANAEHYRRQREHQ